MGSRKLKKISVEEKFRTLLRQHGRSLLGLLVLLLIIHDIFGTHGFLAKRRTEYDIQKVKADLNKLNQENAALLQKVYDLKHDPQTIEAMGRAMGLARPGEAIFKIPDSPTQPTSSAKR